MNQCFLREESMKKIMLALSIALLTVPAGAALADDGAENVILPAAGENFVYDNKVSGISMTIPGNRVENQDSNGPMYQAYLPDEGISLSILSRAHAQPYMKSQMKEKLADAEKFLKESIRNSGEKQLYLKKVKFGGETAFMAGTSGKGEAGNFGVIRYVFLRPDGTVMVSFTMKEEDMKKNSSYVEQLINTVKFYTPMQKISVKGTAYTYDIPASMKVDYDPPVAPDHVLVAGNRLLMTGVAVLSLSENPEFSFLPSSLSGLTDAKKEEIIRHFQDKLASESTGKYVKNVSFLFGPVHGMDGLQLDFDDQGDHTRSYIFVKDGKYISFDYIYNLKEKDYAEGVIAQSVQSISL